MRREKNERVPFAADLQWTMLLLLMYRLFYVQECVCLDAHVKGLFCTCYLREKLSSFLPSFSVLRGCHQPIDPYLNLGMDVGGLHSHVTSLTRVGSHLVSTWLLFSR